MLFVLNVQLKHGPRKFERTREALSSVSAGGPKEHILRVLHCKKSLTGKNSQARECQRHAISMLPASLLYLIGLIRLMYMLFFGMGYTK